MGLWQKFKVFLLDKSGQKTLLEGINKQNRIATENVAAITFTNVIRNSNWLMQKEFYPGRWAVEYSFLLSLFRILDHHMFSNMIEFGLGQSSRVIHQYAHFFNIPALTIEHDAEWVDFTIKDIHNAYPLHVKLLPLEMIKYKGFSTRTYKGIENILKKQKYDFILVDGPFGSEHYSRSQLISLVENSLANTFCIMLDDSSRLGEQETIAEVESTLKRKGINYVINAYQGLCDYTVICSDNLKFFTSL